MAPRPPKISFATYEWNYAKEVLRQFKGLDDKPGRSFVIAAIDESVLSEQFGYEISKLSGFDRGTAVKGRLKNGHHDLFIDPRALNNREIQLSFLDEIGIAVPAHVEDTYQSDHAFPRSAAGPDVQLVRAQFIPRTTNAQYGSMIEKFRKGRRGRLDDLGYVLGNLADLYKSLGLLFYSNDLEENFRVGNETLIGSGLAPARGRRALDAAAEEVIIDFMGDSTGWGR